MDGIGDNILMVKKSDQSVAHWKRASFEIKRRKDEWVELVVVDRHGQIYRSEI